MGTESHDDAGVYRLSDDLALIQTVDYFTPIVDDPHNFGAIAAANSLSDVYAMGGVPRTALNIVGWPQGELEWDTLTTILKGSREVVVEAGAVVVGGHSVKSPEVLFGLSVTGTIHPDKIITNSGARPDDHLFLTKSIGTGVLTTALKKGRLEPEHLATVTATMRKLNAGAAEAMQEVGVNAATDITGFGLLCHLHEMLAAAGTGATIYADRVPLLPGALDHARAGDKAGGLHANRRFVEPHLDTAENLDPNLLDLFCDPQTSGGLLIAVSCEKSEQLAAALKAKGIENPIEIGVLSGREARIRVVAGS